MIVTANGGNSTDVTVDVNPTPPTVAVSAAASPNPVTGTTANLSVLGSDSTGQSNLTYSWSASGPANVSFSAQNTNAAKNTVATFLAAGNYSITATITNPGGLTITSTVSVVVAQTPTQLTVLPPTAQILTSTSLQFALTATDQFGNAIASPPAASWQIVTGIGTITAAGLYKAPSTTGSATVKATIGSATNTAVVHVTNGPPTVVNAAAASAGVVTGHTVNLTVLGDDSSGESSLTYTWTSNGPAPVIFSQNGTNASKNVTVTFSKAGSYSFTCLLLDPGRFTSTSNVLVTVAQQATVITVTPGTIVLGTNGKEQFAATAFDQFGNPFITKPTVTWTLGNGSIGVLNTVGKYTAPKAAGTADIIASVNGVSSTPATVTIAVAVTADTPVVTQVAQASVTTTVGKTVNLTSLGLDGANGGTVTYQWVASGPGAVRIAHNNTATSNNVTATFTRTGTYNFTCLVKDRGGLVAASGVSVTVQTQITSIRLAPATGRMLTGKTRQIKAVARDQFNRVIVGQTYSWSLSGGSVGAVNTTGLFSTLQTPGVATILATADTETGSATLTVV